MKLQTSHILLFIITSVLTFCKCNFEDLDLRDTERKLTGSTAGILLSDVIYSKEALFKFSDMKQNDRFSLVLKGKSMETAQANFTITNSAGKILFSDSFPAEALINYALLPENDSINQLDKAYYIKKRANNFFDIKQFSFPAIKDASDFEPQYSAPDVWETIAQDPAAVGFHYVLHEESGRSIAFDKKNQRTVTYFSCC